MKINIFTYSDKGYQTAERIGYGNIFLRRKFNSPDEFGEIFNSSDALIFVCACGIAVRMIAPHMKSKLTDPAVIVIDDNGKFVIPILSGHIGGANELAKNIADNLDSTFVLTTATDINNRFSVDTWAVKNDCHINDIGIAKNISAAILSADVNLKSDFSINSKLPNGITLNDIGKLGIYISYKKAEPFNQTLRLIPKILHVGIGCRKGKTCDEIYTFMSQIFDGIDINAVKSISSIDIKKDEQGLNELADKYKLPLTFYTASELSQVEGEFTQSDFVKSITGVDNVCERAAYKSSHNGKFVIRKTSSNGITVAVCAEDWSVTFE